ncbi:VTC domain protein [Cryptosporidium felis]|nr:VTC domain protein [Cryptosporidium felis]
MVAIKDYIFRAPDNEVRNYVDTRKICHVILKLASQCGPNKSSVISYLRTHRELGIENVRFPKNLPDIPSETIACDYVFREMMNEEIEKVNKFTSTKHQEVLREIMKVGKEVRAEIIIPVGDHLKEIKRRQNIGVNEVFGNCSAGEDFLKSRVAILKRVEESLNHLSNEIIHLDFYIRTNFKILLRLCRLFDRMLQTSVNVWFEAHLVKEPFVDINVDILLVLLSISWSRFREAEKLLKELGELNKNHSKPEFGAAITVINVSEHDAKGGDLWKPPETFLRSTTKYWVHPNNVVSAKVGIVRYVPYLIFGVSNSELETLLDPYMCVEGHDVTDPNKIEESQAITSVYLDNKEAECFYNRISRFEKAQLFRLRWYGSNSGSTDKEIFVERKTHHESWTGEKSAKERFSIPQKYVFGYLKGGFSVEELSNNGILQTKSLQLATEIQDYILENGLQPFVRTSYLRAAFQSQDNNQVRFSIDTNLCMVNEFISDGHQNEPWCRLAEEVLSKNEVTRFPYAILEVKLQSEQPDWVSEMLKRCNATLVYKFSKFQHGMAILHQDRVPILPHWIEDFNYNNDFVSLSSTPENETTNNCYNSTEGENQIGSLIDVLMSSYLTTTNFDLHGLQIHWNRNVDEIEFFNASCNERSFFGDNSETKAEADVKMDAKGALRSKKIKSLDPKSLFATERVFLYWTRKTIYLSTFVIILTTYNNNNETTHRMTVTKLLLFIPVIIVNLVYGLTVYIARTKTIERRMVKSSEDEKERIDYPKSSLYIFSMCCSILVFSLILNILKVF